VPKTSTPRNIREIAELCQVSVATVSRVLNNKPDVSEEIRRKITEAIKRNNYSPKLTMGAPDTLAVSLEHTQVFSSPYLRALLNSIEDTAFDCGYDIIILRNERLRRSIDHYDLFFKRKTIAGVIMLLTHLEDLFPVEIATEGFPHVVLNSQFAGRVNFIDTNVYLGTTEALRFLIAQGHTRIAFLKQPQNYFSHRERYRAYQDVMSAEGLLVDENLIIEPVSHSAYERGYHGLNSLLLTRDFSALLVPVDGMLGVVQCARDRGCDIPGDLSVIAFDDAPETQYIEPSFTVVAQNFDLMGQHAVREVIRQIESPIDSEHPVKMILAPQLVVRESTAPVRKTTEVASYAI
jgi:DNA-binding LacI/PurR family transcriptional regulator